MDRFEVKEILMDEGFECQHHTCFLKGNTWVETEDIRTKEGNIARVRIMQNKGGKSMRAFRAKSASQVKEALRKFEEGVA